jgi:hypothetical protein
VVAQKRIDRHLQPRSRFDKCPETLGPLLEEPLPLWVGYDRRHVLPMEPRDQLRCVGGVLLFLPAELQQREVRNGAVMGKRFKQVSSSKTVFRRIRVGFLGLGWTHGTCNSQFFSAKIPSQVAWDRNFQERRSQGAESQPRQGH